MNDHGKKPAKAEGETRGQWASNLGFLLATAGAAIGLGNLWKFPYLMGKNGGFVFLIAYLLFTVLLGLPVMITEMSMGRYTQKNPIGAYRSVNKKAAFIGIIGVVSAFIILSYYSVIGGWIGKYIASYVVEGRPPADFHTYIAGTWEPLFWHFVFMAATAAVCWRGTKGIEKASKILMPALLLLMTALLVRSLTLPGAAAGLRFVFMPNGSAFTFDSVIAALGQVFYSMSLGMGVILTYGSYLDKKENIPRNSLKVAGLDTLVAVMAGAVIFPAVFAFGLEPAQGPGLIFDTLSNVFSQIAGGSFFAILFYTLLIFAAVTSAIALLECLVSFAVDTLGWRRGKAVLLFSAISLALGVPSALSFGVLKNITFFHYSFFDFMGVLTDNILLPIGGIAMCIFVGWIWGPQRLIDEMEKGGRPFGLKKAWSWSIRLLTPALIALVTILLAIQLVKTARGF